MLTGRSRTAAEHERDALRRHLIAVMFDGVDSAIRTMRRDVGQIPLPLPRGRQSISVVPEHDPDPAVRGPARARIEAEARRHAAAAASRANEQAVLEALEK
jgi:hypothetical protein